MEKIRDKKYEKKVQNMLSNNRSLSKGKIDIKQLKEKLSKKGINSAKAEERLMEQQRKKTPRRFQQSENHMEIEEPERIAKKRLDPLEQKRRKIQKKVFKDGRKGESDREVFVSKPKHLFSGKSTVGKRDFR